MKLIICGDSHTEAFVAGLSVLKKTDPHLAGPVSIKPFGNGRYLAQPFFIERAGAIVFNRDDYAATYESFGVGPLRRQDGVRHGFCMGFHTAPLFRHPMWRSYAPWRLCENGSAIPVSDTMLTALASNIWQHIRNFYEAALRLGIDFFVIAAPPPRRSHPCMAEGTALEVVSEVDRLFRLSVAQWLTDRKIDYMMPPPYAIDRDGFLLPQFEPQHLPHDHHHANERYGAEFLREILLARGLAARAAACAE